MAKQLYLVSDSSKEHNVEEAVKIAQVGEWLDKVVDWPCGVHKWYMEYNQDCQKEFVNAIGWGFESEESAIIIEDDIVAEAFSNIDFIYYIDMLIFC